ncbi:MAG TPA: DUF4239 domain-containing protein [Oculatellaceae cyanobacterium]
MDVNLSNAALIIIVLLPISISCMLLVRKSVSHDTLKTHHDVTDPLLAVLGTLFTILLGFMLANAMQRFENARDNLQQEAAAVGDVFRLMDGFPAQTRDKGRKDCLAYMDAVIKDEWPEMQKGKLSDVAWNTYGDMWQDCLHIEPKTQGESDVHQTLLASMTRLGECRRSRAAELVYSLPPTLWFIVIFGGLSTIGFTYFFAIEDIRLQILMTSVITIIIGLNIYMLVGYDAPFSGDIAITRAAFETARESLKRIQSHEIH